jgi:lysophospholipase L1-like esterase
MNRPAATTLLLFILLFPVAAAPPPTASQPLPEPASTTEADNTLYLNHPGLMTACQERVAAAVGRPCGVIFIGDSITAGWLTTGREVWDKFYARRDALDFGIGGDKTQNVLWRLEHMDIGSLRPKVAVIMIGTNNFKNTPRQIADGVKAVIEKTRQTFPGVKIILVSIMPNQRANKTMMQADDLIREYDDPDAVSYFDLVPFMPEAGGNWLGLGADRLHPDLHGYEIWATGMEPLLRHDLRDFDAP